MPTDIENREAERRQCRQKTEARRRIETLTQRYSARLPPHTAGIDNAIGYGEDGLPA